MKQRTNKKRKKEKNTRVLSRVLGRKKEPLTTTVKLDADIFPGASELTMILRHNILHQSPFPQAYADCHSGAEKFISRTYLFLITKPNTCGILCNFLYAIPIWKATQLTTLLRQNLPHDYLRTFSDA